jgi:inositol 1,4,5-triphosphate receptor type 1
MLYLLSHLYLVAAVIIYLQVELTSRNSQGCIFKILPRYKVRSVGDEVRYNGQVKLESVKTEGQFLHCSSRPYKGEFAVLESW